MEGGQGRVGGNLGLGSLVLAGEEWAQGHQDLDSTNLRHLPGGWRSQESRDRPVLPGRPSAPAQLLAPTPSTGLTYSSSRAGRPS